MDGVEIRPLNESDASAWWNLRLEALTSEPQAFGTSAEEHRAIPLAEIERRFGETSEDYTTFGAFDGGALVGTLRYVRDDGLLERHKARIFGMYVSPRSRRQGTARALLGAALARARGSSGVEQLLVSVTSTQAAAKALYREFGFEIFGVEPRALHVNGAYVDEESMILRLR